MNRREAAVYDSHKCLVFTQSLICNSKSELSNQELSEAKAALETFKRIYNRRKRVIGE